MLTDPISDFLIQIKNGYMARKTRVSVSHSRMKENIARVLSTHKYIGAVSVDTTVLPRSVLFVELLYTDTMPNMTEVTRISKPGRRVYVGKRDIPHVFGGMGITIISTPQGVMGGKEARKRNLGGEVLCAVS